MQRYPDVSLQIRVIALCKLWTPRSQNPTVLWLLVASLSPRIRFWATSFARMRFSEVFGVFMGFFIEQTGADSGVSIGINDRQWWCYTAPVNCTQDRTTITKIAGGRRWTSSILMNTNHIQL